MVKSLDTGRFLGWGAVDARGVSRGILIFWDNRVLDLMELECGGFTISGSFKHVEDGFVWLFTGVYGLVLSRGKKKTFGMSWVQLKVCGMIFGV